MQGGERERGVRVENKREERECRGWGSIRGRVEEERIQREGEVMKTGAMEMESLLIFRTIFLVCVYSLMFAFLHRHDSLCFY